MYKRASTKRISMSGSVFQASIYLRNVSTDAVHLQRLPLWVHWYRCCIVYVDKLHRRKRLVVVCPLRCMIFMVDKVLLINFVMKCAMWTVVVSRACLNYVRSITSQFDIWVRFLLAQYRSNRNLEILYAIYRAILEWTGNPWMDTLGSP